MPNKTDVGSKKEHGPMCVCCHGGYIKKIMLTLMGVLLVYLIFYFGTIIRNNLKQYYYIGQADRVERTITINGYGKVTGTNDIAVTTIGYSNTNKDVAKAQADNKTVMDKVFADLTKLGIADKDLQSDYTIYPEYNYTQDQGQELVGYKVTNSVTIKIRDLKKISDVLNLAGKYGANNVSGLSFTIDDSENLKTDARDKAITDARTKADYLANVLGVSLLKVVSYNEYEGSSMSDVYAMKDYSGLGGGGAAAPIAVSGGSRDVIMNVSVTYEIY